uniref:Unique cartilage matrix-associated protein n=1 Tax=Electrophorus electricus TaxID=8005 RepID=A0A4W4FFS2_ELEEL
MQCGPCLNWSNGNRCFTTLPFPTTFFFNCGPAAELRQRLAADERKREYHEERMNQFETYAEEEHDEQDERTQEKTEQWREFHYDGLDPSHEYNQGTI